MRICIKIEQLENLLEVAKNAKKSNSDLSNCIEITLLAENKNHAGSDKLRFDLLSGFADCNGQFLGTN